MISDPNPSDAEPPSARETARDVAITCAVAAAGATLFWALGFPAPWLVGAVMTTSAAALGDRIRPLPRAGRKVNHNDPHAEEPAIGRRLEARSTKPPIRSIQPVRPMEFLHGRVI